MFLTGLVAGIFAGWVLFERPLFISNFVWRVRYKIAAKLGIDP